MGAADGKLFVNRHSTIALWVTAWLLWLSIPACKTTGPGIPQEATAPVQDPPPQEGEPQVEQAVEEESEVLEGRRRGQEEIPDDPEQRERARLYWDYGPRFDAFDGDLSIVVGGRVHVDGASFKEDDEINAAFGEPRPGFDARRAFLELGGVYKQVEFNFWLSFADVDFENDRFSSLFGSEVDYRNVFIGVRNLPVVGGVRAGYFKEPFGLEETTSSNDITFMERSLTDAFVKRRNLGVMLHRRFTGERRIYAALGVYREATNDLETLDGRGVTARITGAPILAEGGRELLHVGLSATYREPSNGLLRFLARPESAQAQVLADTGFFLAENDLRVGLELGAVLGSLSLQSEAMVAAPTGTMGSDDPVFPSFYVMGSYVLTGEHRSYRPQVGAFGSVHPTRSFPEYGPGAWELTARYSYLDLDSEHIQGGVLHDVTAGLNWYLNQHARVMFNYIAAHPEGFGTEHIYQLRFQFSF